MVREELSTLGQYIVALCKAQNLSLRQASMRAGLDPTTISKILNREETNTPQPATLEKLAAALNGDYYRMMVLAGHLPPAGEGDSLSAELYAKIQRLQKLVRQVAEQDPEAASRLMGMVITPFEIMLALEGEGKAETVEHEHKEMV